MQKVAWILVLIGAINWGLVGIGGFFGGNWNVVYLALGGVPQLEWIIYILIGISGVMLILHHKKEMHGTSAPTMDGEA